MDLTAVTLVKIDGDIIEEFVRHTLRFVDRVIVADNASLDTTRDILTQLQNEGLPLAVWPLEMIAERTEIATELARRAFAETPSDYILMLDADEFLKAPSRLELEAALTALPAGASALASWTTYVPTPADDLAQPRVLERIRHRRRTEAVPYSKLILPRAFAERPELTVAAGNHFVEGGAMESVELDSIRIAHFPVRSIGQIQSKALLGWSQYLASGFDREGEIAYQWRQLYDRLMRDPHWSSDDLLGIAWHYLDDDTADPELILDPIPPVACRYPPSIPDLLTAAMAYTRQLAGAYAAATTT